MCKTSIITVNFNQSKVTIDLLNSIRKTCAADEVEVILVDNASERDDRDLFELTYPGLKYIRSAKNLGFAGGNNLGINAATGKYLLMVNNDTELINGFVKQLVAEMDANPEIGILSPLILYYDDPNIIQYAGYTAMNFKTGRNETIGFKTLNTNQFISVSEETAFCHGAAMMCRSKDVQEIGLMPEQYFLYYEELDWCEMFKRAGKKIWFTGKTHIFHKESMSVGKESKIKTYYTTRNRFLFIRRNTDRFNTILFSMHFLLLAVPKQITKYLLKGRLDLISSTAKAISWNISHAKKGA